MSKISVIIPVYNVEKYIKECLDSVLCSTLEDIEVIIIDDGSKDNCPQIVDDYAQKDSRIIAIHKQNGGYGQACNTGLNKATGEYIAIVEPDDFIDQNMFSDLYNIAIKNNYDIVKSKYIENYDLKNNNFKKVLLNDFIEENTTFTLKEHPELLQIHPSIWSCIYKREFLNNNNIRFTEAPGAGWTDNPFQVQTLCLAEKIAFINKAYYYWRKCNIEDYKDLKDFSIPVKRSIEIHKWLTENNINEEALLVQLFRRELAYFKITNKMIKFKDIPQYSKLLEEYYNIANPDKLINNKELLNCEKKYYQSLKNNLYGIIIKEKINNIVTSYIKFRFSKKHNYLYIFGYYVWNNHNIEEN